MLDVRAPLIGHVTVDIHNEHISVDSQLGLEGL